MILVPSTYAQMPQINTHPDETSKARYINAHCCIKSMLYPSFIFLNCLGKHIFELSGKVLF